jgi:K+ transporter
VTKILTSQELTGSRNKKTLYTMEQKNGKTVYQAGVVMAIEPKVVNQAIMNEMKENKQLYDRFRASQAYKDLEAEMEKYEAEQNQ